MRVGEQDYDGQSSRQVRIGCEIFLYREKAPFVASGESVCGALEYDAIGDLVRCHECGQWRSHLGLHVWRSHHMTAREYKIRHGLNVGSALCNERIRSKLIAHKNTPKMIANCKRIARRVGDSRPQGNRPVFGGSHELRNRNGMCQKQILKRIGDLAHRLGCTPTSKELIANGLNPSSIEHIFGYRMREVIVLAGLMPNSRFGFSAGRPSYSKEFLIKRLRDHWVRFGVFPSPSDHRRGMLPARQTYVKHFGSMDAAYRAAGLGLAAAS